MRYSERILDSSRPGKYFLLLVFLFLLLTISAIGQTREEKSLRMKAVKMLNAGKFAAAQEIYVDLLKLNPNNPDYNYEMGLAIYEDGMQKGRSVQYFNRAVANTVRDTLPDLFLFTAKAEQYAGNFDIAIEHYYTYLSLKRKEGFAESELEEDISRYIETCLNGKVQFENNKDFIIIENLGPEINSIYPDYSPVVANDESTILFTSRRPDTKGGGKDVDDMFYEDVYYSVNVNGLWTPATNVDTSSKIMNSGVNTPSHDATITYAGDETQLFIYRDQDVWVSRFENGLWTIPAKHQGRINSQKGFEPSVFITHDEKTMLVVSDLTLGYGGRDIYITTKDENGNWRSLKNLGKIINTEFEEDAPFLTPDGNTLYFASTGHNSMGDYDIFKSPKGENGEWGVPQNLGPPINTPGHDRFFVTTDNGAIAYYASDRDGGLGETDVYRMILDCKAVSATRIRGTVFSADKNGPVSTVITIFDPKTNVIINTFNSDPKTGKYEMRLKTETTYGFKIEAEGYLPHSGEFNVPKQCDYFSLYQEIKVENLKDEDGRIYAQRASINNAFFDVDNKIEENFENIKLDEMSETKKDSLRAIMAAKYNPIEITNYVSLVEILDPQGIRLGYEVVGDKDVAIIQTRDEMDTKYSDKLVSADRYYYNNRLPEARAEYLIASSIRPEESYPKQQVAIIESKMQDAPPSAFLSTMSEEDKSKIIVPQLRDSSQLIIPADVAAALSKAEPTKSAVPEVSPEAKTPVKTPEIAKEAAQTATTPPVAAQKPAEMVKTENQTTTEIAEAQNIEPTAQTKPAITSVEPTKVVDQPVAATPSDPIKTPAPANTKPQPASTENPSQATTTIDSKVQTSVAVEEKRDETSITPKSESPAVATVENQKERTKATPTPAQESGSETIVFRNILFDFDKSFLRPASKDELNKIQAYMAGKPMVELQIDGHADWIGTVEYNLALSERRAKTAYLYLLEKGIKDQRLTYQFYGESVPIAPNQNQDGTDNANGRQLNRRCEFKIDQTGTADNVVLKF